MTNPVVVSDEAWPQHGPAFNSWCNDLPRFIAILADAADEAWWSSDSDLKYLDLRIDTRDNSFVLFDRDHKARISPDRVIAAIAKHRAALGGIVKLGLLHDARALTKES